jgi:hypothetical protein
VVVLDASDPIREIVHFDYRMQRVEDVLPSLERFRAVPGGLASIKLHSRVQVHFANDAGGRSTLTKAFEQEDPWALQKLVREIASKPDEGFLIVTYKQRDKEVDFERRIYSALSKAGINASDIVRPAIGNRPAVHRVAVLTWGHETGTNAYAETGNRRKSLPACTLAKSTT